jgi:(R,R)-butanediol dehydrogenase/meso-butanediol dehydrogenase/diacetyl reductase
MKGLQYFGAEDIRYKTDLAIPAVTKPDDVVIKIAFCGICGSDLHEFEGPIFFANAAAETGDKISGKKLPLVLGHEFSGVVEKVGEGVKDLKVGDHVVVDATGHCETRQHYYKEQLNEANSHKCQSCELGYTNTCSDLNFLGLGVDNGGLATYTKYTQRNVHKVDSSIPLDVAALIEPLSVVWHAVELAGFEEGDDGLVIGAGPIGLATLLVLQAKGASKVVVSDPAKARREQAVTLGATGFDPTDYASTEEAIAKLRTLGLKGEGFAASFDCSGIQQTYTTSIQAIRAHGVACNVAIWPHKSVKHYVMDNTLYEKKSVGSLGYQGKDFEGVIRALEAGKIDVEKVKTLITAKVGLKNGVQDGFLELINHKDKNIKILISPELE